MGEHDAESLAAESLTCIEVLFTNCMARFPPSKGFGLDIQLD